MEENVAGKEVYVKATIDGDSLSAVNSLILDYYQKFGRKRDLEQFFSLSTADSDIRDPSSLFWRKMKTQSDSSDSCEGKAGTSTELCRISIKCSVPEHSSSPDDTPKLKDDSVSPPIITEEATSPLQTDHHSPSQSDNESVRSDNNSQKSIDQQLETAVNKPFSPTSSITSQRKLEWDSLGDVGYGNESDRKTSVSGLSTLERLALHQQYSNDPMNDTTYGLPTSQSTPVENIPNKSKKGNVKKTTKIYKKDVDFVELNVPHSSENKGPINVNLTKHISFNVDRDGDVTIETTNDKVVSPEKVSVVTEMTPQVRIDKEIQTTLPNNTKKSMSSSEKQNIHLCGPRFPILLSLNTLRKKKLRRKKFMMYRKRNNKIKKESNSSNLREKSGDQISAAESFEYMPGHIYNQNQVNNSNKDSNSVGNKSSLESNIGFTTDSSKSSKNSFTRDLEQSINLLKEALQSKNNNTNLKEKLIKEVVQRLIKSQYSDDDSGTVFLSGLSFNSKNLGLQKRSDHTTTSTSDAYEVDNSKQMKKPKKSILRVDKFNPSGMASTSQSTPNLCTLGQSEKAINVVKTPTFSNTESDFSSRKRNSTDTMPKMSSEDLYNKYLDALRREQVHKKLLKNKETLLKKKLVCSDTCIKAMPEQNEKSYDRIYKLVKELARNNIDDGSGDATKIGSNSIDQKNIKSQRNHSVFTLSSGKTVRQSKHVKRCQRDGRDAQEAGCSRINNSCSCNSQHYHNSNCAISNRDNYYDSNKEEKNNSNSTKQYVETGNISPRSTDGVVSQNKSDIQYVCLCAKEAMETQDVPDKLLIYKCSRLGGPQRLGLDVLSKASSSVGIQCSTDCVCPKKTKNTTTTTNSLDQSNNKAGLHIIASSTTVMNSVRKASNSSQTCSNIDVLLRSQFSDTTNTCTERRNSEFMKLKNLPPYKQGGYKTTQKLVPMTRAVQTEISINPKISDPTLSDVRFISDFESFRVNKNERCSEIKSMPKQTHCYNNKQHTNNDAETFHCIYESQTETIDDCKEMGTVNSSENITFTETSKKHDMDEKPNLRDNKYNEDQFSIPIKGTNMTLVVSLGANTSNVNDAKTNAGTKENSQSCNQNKVSSRKNSFGEDQTKGVQCTSTDVFTQISNEPQRIKETDILFRNQPIPSITNDDTKTYDKICPVNKCVNESSTKYSTYPTTSQTAKKPFVRANTDPHSMQNFVTNIPIDKKVDVETQKDFICEMHRKAANDFETPQNISNEKVAYKSSKSSVVNDQHFTRKSSTESKSDVEHGTSKDPILNMIQEITKRYTKRDMEKGKRKKCFKEIITVLNYLLDTDESSSAEPKKSCLSSSNTDEVSTVDQVQRRNDSECTIKKSYVDKGVQMSVKKNKKEKSCTESSDIPTSSEVPTTSTDSAACKVLNKIKKECERYHHKRCTHKKRDEYSSTTVNCENCSREYYCSCRSKCKSHKPRSSVDKGKKKAVAYNLIIQTSDSVASEETMCDESCRPIKNVIVKVPSKFKGSTAPFQEVSSKIEKNLPQCSRFEKKIHRSKSLPIDSEMSSEDFSKKMRSCTIRDYLEMNRPDFINKTTKRQDCLKIINQTRPAEQCGPQGLKMIVVHAPKCTHTNCMEPCHVYCSGMPLSCNQCPNSFMQTHHNDVTGIGRLNVLPAANCCHSNWNGNRQ